MSSANHEIEATRASYLYEFYRLMVQQWQEKQKREPEPMEVLDARHRDKLVGLSLKYPNHPSAIVFLEGFTSSPEGLAIVNGIRRAMEQMPAEPEPEQPPLPSV